MKQIDIFGNEIDVNDIPEYQAPVGRLKLKTMQERYGEDKQGRKCKSCIYFIRREYSTTYFKCSLWRDSRSTATDIKANQIGCKKFQQE